MNEAISDLRIDHRWKAIDLENAEIQLAKKVKSLLFLIYFTMEIHEDNT